MVSKLFSICSMAFAPAIRAIKRCICFFTWNFHFLISYAINFLFFCSVLLRLLIYFCPSCSTEVNILQLSSVLQYSEYNVVCHHNNFFHHLIQDGEALQYRQYFLLHQKKDKNLFFFCSCFFNSNLRISFFFSFKYFAYSVSEIT